MFLYFRVPYILEFPVIYIYKYVHIHMERERMKERERIHLLFTKEIYLLPLLLHASLLPQINLESQVVREWPGQAEVVVVVGGGNMGKKGGREHGAPRMKLRAVVGQRVGGETQRPNSVACAALLCCFGGLCSPVTKNHSGFQWSRAH